MAGKLNHQRTHPVPASIAPVARLILSVVVETPWAALRSPEYAGQEPFDGLGDAMPARLPDASMLPY